MSPLILEYALSFAGKPYRYAGANPMTGFDCSGLCVEILQASGFIQRHTDYSSLALYELLTKNGIINKREVGSLSFYGKSLTEISHVTFHLSRFYVLEAGSGDHTTTTLEKAIEQNAFIRISPYLYRKDYLATVLPNYPVNDEAS